MRCTRPESTAPPHPSHHPARALRHRESRARTVNTSCHTSIACTMDPLSNILPLLTTRLASAPAWGSPAPLKPCKHRPAQRAPEQSSPRVVNNNKQVPKRSQGPRGSPCSRCTDVSTHSIYESKQQGLPAVRMPRASQSAPAAAVVRGTGRASCSTLFTPRSVALGPQK